MARRAMSGERMIAVGEAGTGGRSGQRSATEMSSTAEMRMTTAEMCVTAAEMCMAATEMTAAMAATTMSAAAMASAPGVGRA